MQVRFDDSDHKKTVPRSHVGTPGDYNAYEELQAKEKECRRKETMLKWKK